MEASRLLEDLHWTLIGWSYYRTCFPVPCFLPSFALPHTIESARSVWARTDLHIMESADAKFQKICQIENATRYAGRK